MSEVQHAGARKLLRVIARIGAHTGTLTYGTAAKAMGYPDYEKHSRAVAQMCDLLDAAACLAGVPLLALEAVREKDGGINPKAWTRTPEHKAVRSAIIHRSHNHDFTSEDYEAIKQGLSALQGLGNRKAWEFVHRTFGPQIYGHVLGETTDPLYSALDDLGTDDPARVQYAGYAYLRDPRVRAAVLSRAGGRCEYCGEEGFLKEDGSRYLETHHVIALANDGEDRLTNVIALCPNDHRKAHFSRERVAIEKKMQAILQTLNHP